MTNSNNIISKQSFLTQNTSIESMRPTERSGRIVRILKWLVNQLLKPFTILRPDIMKEKLPSLVGAVSTPLSLSFDQLFSHYNEFMQNEKACPPSLKKCFQQFAEDSKVAKKIPLGRSEEAVKKNVANFIVPTLAALRNMKSGEFRLLPLSWTSLFGQTACGFCIVSKQKDTYSLRLVGSDREMQQWDKDLGAKEAGKSALVFENIPASELFKDACLKKVVGESVRGAASAATFVQELKNYRKKEIPTTHKLSIISQRVDKVFWSVVSAFPTPDANAKNQLASNEVKRIALRSELYSLFELFKKHREDLKCNTPTFRQLTLAFEGISRNAAFANKNGYLSVQELEEIRKELDVIESTLVNVKEKYFIPTLSDVTVPQFQLGEVGKIKATPLHAIAQAVNPKINPSKAPRQSQPNIKPPDFSAAAPIHLSSYDKINTKEEFLKFIKDLENAWNAAGNSNKEKDKVKNQYFKFFTEVPIDLFKKIDYKRYTEGLERNTANKEEIFWWKLTKDEAHESFDKIRKLSEAIVREPGFAKNCSQYKLEALFKMGCISETLKAMWTDELSYCSEVGRLHYFLSYRFNSADLEVSNRAGEFHGHGFQNLHSGTSSLKEILSKCSYGLGAIFKEAPYRNEKLGSRFPSGLIDSVSCYHGPISIWNKWLRPISDPYLMTLFRQVNSRIFIKKQAESGLLSSVEQKKTVRHIIRDGRSETIEEENETVKAIARFGRMSPEAFQGDPQGLFEYYIKEYNDELAELEGNLSIDKQDSAPSEPLQGGVIPYPLEEQTRLLMLLRADEPQLELMSFMRECPHLMRNPDVRNYFDAIFFGNSLSESIRFGRDLRLIPKQIQREINELKEKFDASLQDKNLDLNLAKERLDTILYFYEMHEKLRKIYKGENNKSKYAPEWNFIPNACEDIKKLKEFIIADPRFSDSLGYAARVHLRSLMDSDQVTNDKLAAVVQNFVIMKTAQTDPRNVDPYQEEVWERRWPMIAGALEKECAQHGLDNTWLLNLFCQCKNILTDGSPWVHKNGLVYQNNEYEIDLSKLSISELSKEGEIVFLPSDLQKDPILQFNIKDAGNSSLKVKKHEIENTIIYTFEDSRGIAYQVEKTNDKYQIYRKINLRGQGEKWVQCFMPDHLKTLAAACHQEKLKKLKKADQSTGRSSLARMKKMLKNFSGARDELKEALKANVPILFDNGFYVDPKDPLTAYGLDEKGEPAYQVRFASSKEALCIDYVIDLRNGKSRIPQRISTAASIEHKGLSALFAIERSENILIWGTSKQAHAVELLRYGLAFVVENGRLKCTHPDLEGYYLNPSPSHKEKNGFPLALVLEHPHSNKSKKLILPDSDEIILHNEELEAKGSFIGRIILYIEKIIFYIQLILGTAEVPARLSRARYEVNLNKKSISFKIFDLRSYTGEICEKRKGRVADSLLLIKQALKTDQPKLAYEVFNRISFSEENLDKNTFTLLMRFIQINQNLSDSSQKLAGTSAEAALKRKLCLKLKSALKKQKRLSKDIEEKLDALVLEFGKMIPSRGKKMLRNLSLDKEENEHLSAIKEKQQQSSLKSKAASKDDSEQVPKDTALEDSIKALEAQINLKCDLSDASLAHQTPKLAKGKEVPLLFTSDQVKSLFIERPAHLPALNLKADDNSLTSCEKKALEELNADVDQFRKAELSRPQYQINASLKNLNQFLRNEILPKKNHWEMEIEKQRRLIDRLIRHANDADEQLEIYANIKAVATFDELREAFAKGTLEELKKKELLPSSLNIDKLKQALGAYFDAQSRRNAAEAAEKMIHKICAEGDKRKPELWQSLSTDLHRLLTIQRHYNAEAEPRLLIFEAQQFINFKLLDGGLNQLDLLEALLGNPTGIIQAPTGAGKTSVLSVMRSLLKANGNNLVIQKVLPALYQQTHEKMQDVLGDLYHTMIYPLRFNLKMPLEKKETVRTLNKNKEIVDVKKSVSLFKIMYHQMLQTIASKGCILTDYKSLPLLEEKFWKLGQEMLVDELKRTSPLECEHYQYLRKILHLLMNNADENMDEFDQPNRPINKIQLELGAAGKDVGAFIPETSMEIYELLLQDKRLNLAKNIQGDLSEEIRQTCISDAARTIANKCTQHKGFADSLHQYFMGVNENALKEISELSLQEQDKLALYKDQFSIYLPLTLRGNRSSRYDRSNDGTRTIPCYSGEKHDAKFGTVLEQINYTIQDYLQGGIQAVDLTPWINELKKRWDNQSDQAEFRKIFPNWEISEAAKLFNPKSNLGAKEREDGIAELIQEVNKDNKKIFHFLKLRLAAIKASGAVVTMNPQNIVDMSRVVSGTSATMGAPESLHRQFHVDHRLNGSIRANMTMRLCRRAKDGSIIKYDPLTPYEMMEQANKQSAGKGITAVIDGAGAFKDSAKEVAKALRVNNVHLKQVGYHEENEAIGFDGQATGNLKETGFFFSQSHTRGTDIALDTDALAILTLGERDGLREFFQKEGRLRKDTQRYLLAVSKYQTTQSLDEEIGKAACNDALLDAQDIFRKCKQELQAIVRNAAKRKLLSCATPDAFVKEFKNNKLRELFITDPAEGYGTAGSYFKLHQHIRKNNDTPQRVLDVCKQDAIKDANGLGLANAVKELNSLGYSKELLEKMPSEVPPVDLNVEIEVEQEQEQEQEQENELELEHHQGRAVSNDVSFPVRVLNTKTHSVFDHIHQAYDKRIHVSDPFLPLSRQGTASLHKRSAFDSKMFRVGMVSFDVSYSGIDEGNILKIVVEDPLEDTLDSEKLRPKVEKSKYSFEHQAFYDIRTRQWVKRSIRESQDFIRSIAQIRFFDGQLDGYTDEEFKHLREWLVVNGVVKMRDHLLKEILQFRLMDKLGFESSQLGKLFRELDVFQNSP